MQIKGKAAAILWKAWLQQDAAVKRTEVMAAW